MLEDLAERQQRPRSYRMKRPTKGVWPLSRRMYGEEAGASRPSQLKTFHEARLDEADQNSQNAEN